MIEKLAPERIKELKDIALHVRKNIIELAFKAGKNSAHCGGSLSSVEILTALYHQVARVKGVAIEDRDRIIISKAHASLVQYCVLESIGLLSQEEIDTFEQSGSHFTVHAHKDLSRGLEFSGGSLGLGLSYAVGMAFACKQKGLGCRIFVLLGDGECDEGIVWESLLFAKHHQLDNLTVIVDHNHLQADGTVEDVLDTSSLAEKFKAFGFYTHEVDGHNMEDLYKAFGKRKAGAPTSIIAETVKGKGISFMENKYNWHFTVLPEAKYLKAMAELNK